MSTLTGTKSIFKGLARTLAAVLVVLIFTPLAFAKSTDVIEKQKLKYKPVSPDKELQWRMRFAGTSFADLTDDANIAGTALNLKTKMKFGEYLSFKGNADIVMSAGRVQSRFDQNNVFNGIRMGEALLQGTFINERIYLQAGVLSQNFFENSQFVAGSFPGARAVVHIQKQKTQLYDRQFVSGTTFVVQSALPTSRSLDSERAEKEATPSFTTESIISNIKVHKRVGIELNATHFKFSNLPASVARRSALNGNSVFDAGQPTARFAFDFEGYSLMSKAHLLLSKKISFHTGATLTENQEALEGYGRSYSGFVGATYGSPMSNFYEIVAGNFFTEGDSVPAFYMGSRLGLQNRVGTFLQTTAEFSRLGFKTHVVFSDADVLEARPAMSRQQTIELILETYYEDLL